MSLIQELKDRSVESRIEEFRHMCKTWNVPNGEALTDWLDAHGFFSAPASTKYHGCYPGGLYDHSLCVYMNLNNLTMGMGLKWERECSPFIVGMLHDVCKADQYLPISSFEVELDSDGRIPSYKYNTKTLLKGHGDKSLMLLSTILPLTEEEMLCIRYHMGAFTEKEEWSDYTGAIHCYPNVLWAHQADMMAAHIDMV